jgi:hypothetical protein
MARLARVVIPDHPHHVTQRGNGRARTFFGDPDYALYRDLLAANCRADMLARLRAAESIGRPLGNDQFLAGIERLTGRRLKPGKRGPKPLAADGR